MERRIGAIIILIENPGNVGTINRLLSDHSSIILGRQGLPLRDKNIRIISLVTEGTTDELGALSGKLGNIDGVQVKSVLTRG
jgi:putative iron-only hydrogenase system regulator